MSKLSLGPLECLTNAPEDYDYGWMRTVAYDVAKDDRGRPLRLARNADQWHYQQQLMRYGSGMNVTITDQRDLDKRVELGFVVPTPEQRRNVYYFTFDLEDAVRGLRRDVDIRRAIGAATSQVGEATLEPHGYCYDVRAVGEAARDAVLAIFGAIGVTPSEGP